MRVKLTYSGVASTLALTIAMSSGAYAATGGNFILGQANTATTKTALSAVIANKALAVSNTSTDAGATALGLTVAAGKPPMTVNSTTRVASLNVDLLDGLDATAFQRPLSGGCADRTAISAITPVGGVSCTSSAVFPIAATLARGASNITVFLGKSSLQLLFQCSTSNGSVSFQNGSSNAATLNWMFSGGGTSSTVNASGTVIGAFQFLPFIPSATGRLEGQWIFRGPAEVTTVNLHFFYDGSSFCELNGTALVAFT